MLPASAVLHFRLGVLFLLCKFVLQNSIIIIYLKATCSTTVFNRTDLAIYLQYFDALSVRLLHLFHNDVPIIVSPWNFQELLPLTKVVWMQIVKVWDQRSRSRKSKQMLSKFWRFRTVTLVWIHRWLRNYARNLKWHRIIYFHDIRQLSGLQGPTNLWFCPDLSVSRWKLQFEIMVDYEMAHIAFKSMEKVPYCFPMSNLKVTRVEKSIWRWDDGKTVLFR